MTLRPGMFTLMNQAIQNQLLSVFQTAANADPVNSIAILESGGFKVKGQAIHKENIFEGTAGTIKGSVVLKSPGGPKNEAHLHLWYSSLDGVTFALVAATNAATATLSGYKSGTIVYFRTQLSIKDVLQGMSQTIEVSVK